MYFQYVWFFNYFHFTKSNGCKMESDALNSTLGGSILPNNDIIFATITAASLVTDSMRQVTENLVASPVATHPPFSATELGLPSTPDSRQLICMNESENQKGYNSDGKMGLFYDEFYDEEPLLCYNEVEVGNKLLEPAPEIPSPAKVLTHADIDKLKVVELKEELKKRA